MTSSDPSSPARRRGAPHPQPPSRRRGTGGTRRGRGSDGHRSEPILRPWSIWSGGGRYSWRSTAGRSRWPTTVARCSTCCARRSTCGRRRTAAARGSVRLLHRAGGRPAAGRVRDTRAPSRRPASPPRRARRRGAGPIGRRILRDRREPVRLLHAGDHLPARRAAAKGPAPTTRRRWQGLLAHLCRCTGWRTILEAWDVARRDGDADAARPRTRPRPGRRSRERDPQRMAPRSRSGGWVRRRHRPADALVAVPDGRAAGRSARRSRRRERRPARSRGGGDRRRRLRSMLPAGDWAATPANLLGRAGVPRDRRVVVRRRGSAPLAARQRRRVRRQGASVVIEAARSLADPHGRTVRVLLDREDIVRLGPKRPPIAGGADADGSGILQIVRTPGIAAAVALVAPDLVVEEVDVAGPPTSTDCARRGMGRGARPARHARGGATRRRPVHPAQWPRRSCSRRHRRVQVDAGEPLDEMVLRSYCTGAAHMALSWVRSEGIAVDEAGTARPHDPVVRRPARRRHAADRDRDQPERGTSRAGRTPCSWPWRRPPGGSSAAGRVADGHQLALAGETMSKPVGPYTPIVRAGEWLVVSGRWVPSTGSWSEAASTPSPPAVATWRPPRDGGRPPLDDVTKTTVFLRHLRSDYAG